jgi:hypothetical protein
MMYLPLEKQKALGPIWESKGFAAENTQALQGA